MIEFSYINGKSNEKSGFFFFSMSYNLKQHGLLMKLLNLKLPRKNEITISVNPLMLCDFAPVVFERFCKELQLSCLAAGFSKPVLFPI